MVNKLRTLHKFCALIGLAPYSQCPRQQQWQRCYGTLLITINLTITIYAWKYTGFENTSFVSDLANAIAFTNQTIAFTINLFEVITNYRQHYRFLAKAQHIKQLLQRELCAQIHWQQFHRQQFYKLLFYIIVAFGGFVLMLVTVSVDRCGSYYFYAFFDNFILRWRCWQLIIYVNYIGFYLRTLNRRLCSLVSCKVEKQRFLLDVNYKRLESLEYLLALKNVYNEIFEFTAIFNDFCGWSVLSLSVVLFFHFLINMYYIVLWLENLDEPFFVIMIATSCLTMLVIIVMFCQACEICKRQSSVTRRHLQRLLIAPHRQDLNTKAYNCLVKKFVMQIMQYPIQIESKGFFIVDLKQLMNVLAITITYLVVLMQFRGASLETQQNNA